MITIHRQLKYVIFFAIGFFVGSVALASADTYTRTPSGNVTNDTFNISWTIDDINNVCPAFPPFGQPATQYRVAVFDQNSGDYSTAINTPWYPVTTLSGSFDFTNTSEYVAKYVYVTCDDGSNVSEATSIWESNANNAIFTISAYVAPTTTPTTTPVAGAFSFVDFNDVSPTDMVASVRAGTVETTGKTLPLLVFLGIPLAFLLLVMVSKLISNSVKPEKKGNGRGWTAHGAMEHDLTAFKKKERSRIKRDL